MLLYNNRSFLRILLEHHGSVALRRDILIMGTVLSAIAIGLCWLITSGSAWAPYLPHHFGMHAIGVIVSFASVFRMNLAWARYWEAMTQQHFMYSKWADAYSQFHAFTSVTVEQTYQKGGEGSASKIRRLQTILKSLKHNFSLLSAMAADRLSHGDTYRMERRSAVARWQRQIVWRHELRSEDLTGVSKLPELLPLAEDEGSQHIHQQVNRHEWETAYVVLDQNSERQTEALTSSQDRVDVVMYWIVHDLARASKDLDIAPPIQSRMYQELSNGMLGFSNSLKIADVPFPFPYAQLMTFMLTIYALFIPVYIVCFTESLIAAPILTFLLFAGIWGVNEVAKELENPFGTDVNDISLADHHARFLDVLRDIDLAHSVVEMAHEKEPEAKDRSAESLQQDKHPLWRPPTCSWPSSVAQSGAGGLQQAQFLHLASASTVNSNSETQDDPLVPRECSKESGATAATTLPSPQATVLGAARRTMNGHHASADHDPRDPGHWV